MTVHILKHGRALCGQPGMPVEWPEDHKWVSFEDEANLHEVDCPGCREAFKPPAEGEGSDNG